MILYAGDVVLTHSRSLLGKLIRFAEQRPGDPSEYNHVGMITRSGSTSPLSPYPAIMTEALWHVRTGPISQFYGEAAGDGRPSIAVYRPTWADSAQRTRVADVAEQHVGQRYGWWKLLLHAGDAAISAFTPIQDCRCFRRLLFADSRPICSYLVARAWKDGAGFEFGVPPQTASPDDIHDFCRLSPEWKLIHEGLLR